MRCVSLSGPAERRSGSGWRTAFRLILLWCLLAGFSSEVSALTQDDTAAASVRPAAAEIGVPVVLSVDVCSAAADYQPVKAGDLRPEGWEVREALRWEIPAPQGQRRWHYELTLVRWQPGKQSIPPLAFGSARTEPLQVQVIRPPGEEMAFSRPGPGSGCRERLFSFWAWGGAVLGMALGCLAAAAHRRLKLKKQRDNLPQAAAARLSLRLERIKELSGGQGRAEAEEAVRLYWKDILADGRRNATLRELAQLVPGEWRELLLQLEACKYNPDSAEAGGLDRWLDRVLDVLKRE